MIRRWVLMLCAAGAMNSLLPGFAVGDDSASKSEELDALRRQIDGHRSEAARLAGDESDAITRLESLEKEILLTQELVEGLIRRDAELGIDIGQLEAGIDETEDRIDVRRDRLALRLRKLYKSRRHSDAALILESRSMRSLAMRMRAITHVARTEGLLIDEVRAAQLEGSMKRAQLEESLSETHLMRSEAMERQAGLELLQAEREGELAKLRRERGAHDAARAGLEQAAQNLETLIAELDSKRRGADTSASTDLSFPSMKGQLPWPADGPVTQGFGRQVHPEFKTVVISKGITIAAPMGAPIQAVAPGRVELVRWLPGYGKCVILNHGGGYYSLYAHAREVFAEDGDEVALGFVIAEVGDTGSLDGAQLYFEIRSGKDPVDPMPWMSRPAR